MIKQITFDEIYPIWKNDLWPDRVSAIEPLNCMMFMGGWDSSVEQKYKPVFFAYIDNGKILGVNSGFQTSEYTFRSRGIWVYPEHRSKGIAKHLLDAVVNYAKEETSACIIWSIPRKTAFKAYEAVGFSRIGPWFDKEMEFGPNCYAYMEIKE